MKIAWFTPFSRNTAIGKYSESVVIALKRYYGVDLFISEKKDLITTRLSKIYYKPDNVLSLLEHYDICIYNIGDDFEYNTAIFDVVRQRPGLIIIHDLNRFNSNIIESIHPYSLGFVVHSSEYESKIKSVYAGSVCIIPPIYDNEGNDYSEKLYEFIQSVNFLKPLYSLTDLISQELIFMGVSSDMRIYETISNEIDLLFRDSNLRKGIGY